MLHLGGSIYDGQDMSQNGRKHLLSFTTACTQLQCQFADLKVIAMETAALAEVDARSILRKNRVSTPSPRPSSPACNL